VPDITSPAPAEVLVGVTGPASEGGIGARVALAARTRRGAPGRRRRVGDRDQPLELVDESRGAADVDDARGLRAHGVHRLRRASP
jgi:hypothetical protein